MNLRATWIWPAAFLLGGCSIGGDDSSQQEPSIPPPHGTVSVSVTTTGAEPDASGYTVLIDGVGVSSVGTTESVSVPLRTGGHSVGMTGLSCNCTITGANPQIVTVAANVTAPTSFAVSCPARDADPESVDLQVAGDGFAITSLGSHVVVARTVHPANASGDELAISALTFDATAPFRTIHFSDPDTLLLDDLQVAMQDGSDAIVAVTRQPATGLQTQVRMFRFNNLFDLNPGLTVFREITPLALGYAARATQANGTSLPVVVYDDETQPPNHLSMVGTVDSNGIAATVATLASQLEHVGISLGSADTGYLAGITKVQSIELHPLDVNGEATVDFQTVAEEAENFPIHEATSLAWCNDRYALTWWRAAPDPNSSGQMLAELRALIVDRMGVPLQQPVTLGAPVDLGGGASLHAVGIGCLDNSGFAFAHADADTGLHLLLTDASLVVQTERSIATGAVLADGTAPTVMANDTTVMVAWMEAPGATRISRSCQ